MSQRIVPKEYLGAFKAGHRKASKEFIDEGLSQQLLRQVKNGCEASKEALAWLTKFNNEFHKNVIKKGDQTALHKKDVHRLDCYSRQHAINRDIASVGYRTGSNDHSNLRSGMYAKTEENLIQLIDILNEQRLATKN